MAEPMIIQSNLAVQEGDLNLSKKMKSSTAKHSHSNSTSSHLVPKTKDKQIKPVLNKPQSFN